MATRTIHAPIKPGDPFGRWTVIGPAEPLISGHRSFKRWLCRCECGTERPVTENTLHRGVSVSCGCLQREVTSKRRRTHGATVGTGKTPEYEIWAGLIKRCTNLNAVNYKDYGGRGIAVCDRWRHGENGVGPFECFLEDMGCRPSPEHSLDRWPDNDAGYEPGNCRWATRLQQGRNKRNNLLLTFDGKTMPVSEWAADLGMTVGVLYMRIRNGWSVERTLTTPIGARLDRN